MMIKRDKKNEEYGKKMHFVLQIILKKGLDLVDSQAIASILGVSMPTANRYLLSISASFDIPIVRIGNKNYLVMNKELLKKFPPSARIR